MLGALTSPLETAVSLFQSTHLIVKLVETCFPLKRLFSGHMLSLPKSMLPLASRSFMLLKNVDFHSVQICRLVVLQTVAGMMFGGHDL
jgi:hypothetical protein